MKNNKHKSLGAIFTLVVLAGFQSAGASNFPASASLNLNCGGGDAVFQVGGEPGTYSCNYAVTDNGGGTVETYAEASLTNAINPSIVVSASTNNSIDGVDPQLVESRSLQDMTYYFSLEAIAQTPFDIDDIPLLFSATAGGNSTGDYAFEGGVFIINSSGLGIGQEFNQESPNLQFDFADVFRVGIDYRVTLEADCFSNSTAIGSSSCSAFVASNLNFDQALFDQMFGDDSFLLADHFRINLSPNLMVVPLPATIWMLLVAIGVLPAYRRRVSD